MTDKHIPERERDGEVDAEGEGDVRDQVPRQRGHPAVGAVGRGHGPVARRHAGAGARARGPLGAGDHGLGRRGLLGGLLLLGGRGGVLLLVASGVLLGLLLLRRLLGLLRTVNQEIIIKIPRTCGKLPSKENCVRLQYKQNNNH